MSGATALGLLLLLVFALGVAQSPTDPEPVMLRLQAATFDPFYQTLPVPAPLVAVSAPPSDYALVQFVGPVQPVWRAALERSGARVLDYLPDYAYVVRLLLQRRAQVAALPGVRWVGSYLPVYKVAPVLWTVSSSLTLTLQLFPDEDPAPVAYVSGVRVLEQAVTPWQTTLRLRAGPSALPALAALPGVRWIEPYVPPGLANDVAVGIVGAPTAWVTLTLTGTGQTIAVADTGLDVGDSGPTTDFGHIVATHCLGRLSTCLWDDPHGHGTHVAGSALGSGALAGGQFKGLAYGADLVVQSLYSPTLPGNLYVPPDLSLLFAPAYADGARVHNNSWGSPVNRYDVYAEQADQFVWDHPDMVIVFAAGNGGIDRGADGVVDPGSLHTPATAKNVIAVGASESLRAGQGYTGTYGDSFGGADFPANPVRDDTFSNAPWGLAAFSSRGPAPDERVRPDLVAPGTNVVSARSHHPEATYPYTYSADYAFGSGTSQAAPLVSGAAALVRQWYATRGYTTPSAALVRATLVHGADDLSPGQYGPPVTGTVIISDNVEGQSVWEPFPTDRWIMTNTWGYHSPDHAWVASGSSTGPRWLQTAVTLTGVSSPTLTWWNRRWFDYSTGRVEVYSDTGWEPQVTFQPTDGGHVGWAREGVSLADWSGESNVLLRFWFQLTSSGDFWALDDIMVLDSTYVAEVSQRPDEGQGWGRLDLRNSLYPTSPSFRWYADEVRGLQTGQALGYMLTVTDTSVPLRATLTWSDYPASPAAAAALVNDVDLELEEPGGAIFYHNGLANPDRTNNVEQIEQRTLVTGTYRLVVRGYNIPFGPQPYALVVTLGGVVTPLQVYLPLVVRGSL